MFKYIFSKMLDAPSFLQRLAEHTGITDPSALGTLLQSGIDSGSLSVNLIGNGEEARLFVTNNDVRVRGLKTQPRLIREQGEWTTRAKAPVGQIMGVELSADYKKAVDYLDSLWFRPNSLVLETMEALASKGFFKLPTGDTLKGDRMELLLLAEFRNFGTAPYLLPLFPDRRFRIYTEDSGVGSYQLGDWHRAICDLAVSKAVNDEDIAYALPRLEDEYGVTEDNYLSILDNPVAFVQHHADFGCPKKPGCSLRAAEAIREMLEDGCSSYILQQDQSNSGAALYSWFTGDRSLAKHTNFLPSETKQCLYTAAAQIVASGNLLPVVAEANLAMTSRGTSKGFIVPMIYGAANVSLTRSLFLDKPQKDRTQFVDEAGSYIPGSLDGLRMDRMNTDHFEFLNGLGWDVAVHVGSDIARAYESAIFGSKDVRGLTTRLRTAMTDIKAAARAAADHDRQLVWTSPSGCRVLNHKLVVDTSEEALENPLQVSVQVDGNRRRISFLPLEEVSSTSAAPPNVIHSVDGSVVHWVAGACADEGIALAPIHDSFGTHICDARRMKELVRGAIARIPGDFLDKEIFEPNKVPTLASRGWYPLPVKEFMKAQHFLG